MDGYGKRILIIDDDITCRSLLEDLLEGYAVQTACDGIDGLTEMRKRRFDAVITDHCMPRLNGLDTFSMLHFRQHDSSATPPQAVVYSSRFLQAHLPVDSHRSNNLVGYLRTQTTKYGRHETGRKHMNPMRPHYTTESMVT